MKNTIAKLKTKLAKKVDGLPGYAFVAAGILSYMYPVACLAVVAVPFVVSEKTEKE